MPNLVSITRGADAPAMRRGDVRPGQVFAVKNARTGRIGKQYAHIGSNGRLYSVNVATQELASSANEGSAVVLTGRWSFAIDRNFQYGANRVGQVMRRSDVRPGEIFRVKGGNRDYAHMGSIEHDLRGWLSVPLDNTDNHAVTRNGDSEVTVVGTFKLAVTLAK